MATIENTSLKRTKGKIEITGSRTGLPFGQFLLTLGMASHHISDYVGSYQAGFPLRALWIKGDALMKVTSSTGCSFSKKLMGEAPDKIAQRLFELGFNTLVFGSWKSADHPPIEGELYQKFAELQAAGIRIVVKLEGEWNGCPLDPKHAGSIQEKLQDALQVLPKGVDIFYSSQWNTSKYLAEVHAKDATLGELVLAELRLVEEVLPQSASLFFHLPYHAGVRESFWEKSFQHLCDDAGIKTAIAFDFCAGAAWEAPNIQHPLWEILRTQKSSSSTPLIPIVDIGAVTQGEGLWPLATVDLIPQILPFVKRHPLAGVIGLVPGMPLPNSLLEASVSSWGYALWTRVTDFHFFESWGMAHFPELGTAQFKAVVDLSRDIANKIHFLESGGPAPSLARQIGESLAGRAKELEALAQLQKSALSEIVPYFIRDARRSLLRLLQEYQISLPNLLQTEDWQEGIWTEGSSLASIGKAGGKVTLLSAPNRGAPGSRLDRWVQENYV